MSETTDETTDETTARERADMRNTLVRAGIAQFERYSGGVGTLRALVEASAAQNRAEHALAGRMHPACRALIFDATTPDFPDCPDCLRLAVALCGGNLLRAAEAGDLETALQVGTVAGMLISRVGDAPPEKPTPEELAAIRRMRRAAGEAPAPAGYQQ